MAKKNAAKKRGEVSMFTIFAGRPVVGKWQLEPLTAGRMCILEERKNPIAVGMKEGEDVPPIRVYELLFVASQDAEELAEASFLEEHEWKVAVRKFSLEVTDDELQEAWDVFNAELSAVNQARTVAKKKDGEEEGGEEVDYPHWSVTYLSAVARETGWSSKFILWELPFSQGLGIMHSAGIHHGQIMRWEDDGARAEEMKSRFAQVRELMARGGNTGPSR